METNREAEKIGETEELQKEGNKSENLSQVASLGNQNKVTEGMEITSQDENKEVMEDNIIKVDESINEKPNSMEQSTDAIRESKEQHNQSSNKALEHLETVPTSTTSELSSTSSGDLVKGQEPVVIQSNVLVKKADPPNNSALSLLSEYISDDDEEDKNKGEEQDSESGSEQSVIEVPVKKTNQDYRNKVIDIESDTDDADTDSSSSSSSNSEGRTYYLNNIRKKIEHIYDVDNDDEDAEEDDDEEGEGGGNKAGAGASKNAAINKKKAPLRAKGELLLEDLPPIEDLHISVPEQDCVELGKIQSIVDKLVLVNALPDSTVVDLESVLFLEKGQKVLGEVFDVLGQVSEPLYCVRFNSKEQIEEKGIQVGDKVYTAPNTQYTKFVILGNLMKYRGSDASWEHDVEPPPQYIEYSDDEEERAARNRTRNKQRKNDASRQDGDNDEAIKRSRDDAMSVRSSSPESIINDNYNRRPPRQRGRSFRGSPGNMQPRGPGHHHHAGGGHSYQNFGGRNNNSWHSNYSPRFMGPRANSAPRWNPAMHGLSPFFTELIPSHQPLLQPPPSLGFATPHTAHGFMQQPRYPPQAVYQPYLQLPPPPPPSAIGGLMHPTLQGVHHQSPPAPPGEE